MVYTGSCDVKWNSINNGTAITSEAINNNQKWTIKVHKYFCDVLGECSAKLGQVATVECDHDVDDVVDVYSHKTKEIKQN